MVIPEGFEGHWRSVISCNENQFVLFSFLSVEPDLGPDLSRFRIDAKVLSLSDVFVVYFEEVAEIRTGWISLRTLSR